ncbi:MAG: SpoIID/LytB domain-containing protein [Phycisphaerales bacterium]|nr:SpoIID/LytB domain-containing protein [Phycisphaerales bacterium]
MPFNLLRILSHGILLLLIAYPAGCVGRGRQSGEPPMIRVRLAAAADSVTIQSSEPATVEFDYQKPMPIRLDSGPAVVTRSGGQWRIGSAVLDGGAWTLRPSPGGVISLDGVPFRGVFRFLPSGPNQMEVVNHVDAESYLQGVLPRELYRDWTDEAYRAQAIAARTYALYEARSQGAARHYDVFADVRSQVYGGLQAETAKANEAVAATRGIVAAFGPPGKEKIFKAYFSACCGGVGQNVRDSFHERSIPPLDEKNVRGLCSISPRFTWPDVAISKSELTRRIQAWAAGRNHPIGRIQMLDRIEIEATNRFGRPTRFLLTDITGQRYSLGVEETRWACNADRGEGPYLLSGFFKPVNQTDRIVFTEGRGSGHGVGMCQWCVEALGRRGVPAEEIVRFSYPGAVLVKAY